jgi:hypothetical protein
MKGESIDSGEGVGPSNSTDEAVITSRGGKGMGQSTESNCQLGNQEELSLNVYV